MLRLGFKLDVPHDAECWYASGHSDQPAFVMPDGIEWNRARNGRRRGSTAFARFRCNDPKCEAIGLVRLDVLSEFVTRGVEDRPE